jgi:magnesium-transporting ATPase (P-type)
MKVVPEVDSVKRRQPTRKKIYVAEPDRTIPFAIPTERGVLASFASNHVVTSKYTSLNFLPKFLMEQFRKSANIWFLFVSVLELIPSIAISDPGTGTIGVLFFVIVIEAITQLVEDSKRKMSDRQANSSATRVYNKDTKSFETTTWKDIRCGHVVKIYSYETFPADLLVLCSSDGLECYVETKSLDGETNLKLRSAPKVTYDAFRQLSRQMGRSSSSVSSSAFASPAMKSNSDDARNPRNPRNPSRDDSGNDTATDAINDHASSLSSRDSMASGFTFHVTDRMVDEFQNCICDGQDPRDILTSAAIDTFQGKMILNEYLSTLISEDSANANGSPLNDKNICLRGCTLRNTDFMYGLVVNTGNDTKIMKSTTTAPSKQSDLDKTINHLLSIFLILLLATCITGTILNAYWVQNNLWWEEDLFGGGVGEGNAKIELNSLAVFGQLFITMAQMIPISLYVTMKMARVFQTYFMTHDTEMIHRISAEFSTDGQETIIKPKVRTVDLNDDIGQISYIFSDKTGTLTQNIMEFRKCSINGVSYGSGTTMIGIAALVKGKYRHSLFSV